MIGSCIADGVARLRRGTLGKRCAKNRHLGRLLRVETGVAGVRRWPYAFGL